MTRRLLNLLTALSLVIGVAVAAGWWWRSYVARIAGTGPLAGGDWGSVVRSFRSNPVRLLNSVISLRSVRWEDALTWTYWAVVAACAGWVVLRWLAVTRRFGLRRRRTEPRCARCGYIVGRGCTVVCAECGSDVREGGIVTPDTPPQAGVAPGVWYVLAVLAPLPVALAIGDVVARWQPFGWDYQALWVSDLDTRRPGPPADGTHRFMVHVFGSGRHFGRRPVAVALWDQAVVDGVPEWGTLGTLDDSVTAPDWTYVERDPGGAALRRVRFDGHAADAWVAKAAPEAPPAERLRVASEIQAHFDEAIRGDLPSPAARLRPGLPGLGRPGVMVRYDTGHGGGLLRPHGMRRRVGGAAVTGPSPAATQGRVAAGGEAARAHDAGAAKTPLNSST